MSDTPYLRFTNDGDDDKLEVTLVLNGEDLYIASANHDEHGWAGMSVLECGVTRLIELMGGYVVNER